MSILLHKNYAVTALYLPILPYGSETDLVRAVIIDAFPNLPAAGQFLRDLHAVQRLIGFILIRRERRLIHQAGAFRGRNRIGKIRKQLHVFAICKPFLFFVHLIHPVLCKSSGLWARRFTMHRFSLRYAEPEQTKTPAVCTAGVLCTKSKLYNVHCAELAVFRVDLCFKSDLLALVQGLEAFALNGREMHENIVAACIIGDEAVTLFCVEPLNCTVVHDWNPRINIFVTISA